MSNRRVKKIKFDGVKVLINFEKENKNGEWDEFSMTCHDEPAPEFKEALKGLLPSVQEILELSEGYIQSMRVCGVSISHSEDGDIGAVLTCRKDLKTANSPLILNTPHLPLEDKSEAGNPCMTVEQGMRLDRMMLMAFKYIDGDRAQMVMALDKAEKENAEVDDELKTALNLVFETGRCSTSMLQRRLRIGFTRAARLMDAMEAKGWIGPPKGSDPREILVKKEEVAA